MPNYFTTGTVLPAHDCWYAKTSQCVSRDCMKSANPDKACPKRFWHQPPPQVYRPPVYRPPVRYYFRR